MEVRVLGSIEVHNGHRLALGGPRQRRILAALAMRAGDVLSIDQLVDITWSGEDPPAKAEQNVRTYVHRLRAGLGDDLADRLETQAPGYVLRLEDGELDATRLDELCAAATRVFEQGDAAAALGLVDRGLELWHGQPYDEFRTEAWVQAEAARLGEVHARALELRCDALLELQRPEEAVATAQSLVESQPYREGPRRLLMLGLYRSGRQPEALRAFQDFRSMLAEEVGVDPSRELAELEHQILDHDPGLDSTGDKARALRGYELDEVVGEGAFALVWRGTQPVLGREVAVKQIRAQLANDANFIRRFEVEAQIVSSLEHPYIVPLYDYWREPDAAYLVMRMLKGGTLETRLVRGPLDDTELRRLVDQIGSALRIAHRNGVIHRDVKPGNILLDEEGNFFLTDFGIAFGVTGEDDAAAALSTGSPQYASPEQLRRDELDARTDIYALGVTLFEASVGEPPFADERTRVGLVRRQLEEDLPIPSTERASVAGWVDDVVAGATAKDPANRFASIDQLIVAADTSEPVAVTSGAAGATMVGVARNPFKGLRAFSEADAADFRGRERLLGRLLEVLEQPGSAGRLLAAVGPSGSGKSSVVRAGLVPALRRGAIDGSARWFFTTMMPGARPFEELERALLRVADRAPGPLVETMMRSDRGISRAVGQVVPEEDAELVLVIDQFEELFTLVESADERHRFLDGLIAAIKEPRSRLRVVVTIRADFWDRPLAHAGLAALLESAAVTVTPLGPDELERVIVDPVTEQGMGYEPGLVARISAEVVDQPGALPLLQYTLTELFERSISGLLTSSAYDEMGGLTGALAQRAEELYAALDEEQRVAARRLFGRLVTLGEGTEDTRRRVTLEEVGTDPAVANVIDVYGRARLLAFDRDPVSRTPTIEVAHEALIREWPRLRGWLDEDRDGLRIQRGITQAARQWVASGREDADLFRGGRLEAAAEYQAVHDDELNETEREFVAASAEAHDEEAARTRRTNRRLRLLAIAVSVIAILALIAGAVAFAQQREADEQRTAAEIAAIEADEARAETEAALVTAVEAGEEAETARFNADTVRMATEATSRADANPQLALLLAAEANNRAPNAATLGELQRTMLRTENLLGFVGQPDRQYHAVRWSGDGARMVAVHDKGIEVFDASTSELLWTEDASPPALERQLRSVGAGDFAVFEVSPDGRFAGLATQGDQLALFDLENRSVARLAHPAPVSAVAFSPDASVVATGDAEGVVRLWRTDDGREQLSFAAHPESSPFALEEELVDLGVDIRAAAAADASYVPAGQRGVSGMVFADGGRVLVTAEPPVVRAWDLAEVSLIAEHIPVVDNSRFGIGLYMPVLERLEADPGDSQVVGIVGRLNLLRLNWRTGEQEQFPLPTDRLDSNASPAGAELRPDGTWVVSLSDGRVRVLDQSGDATGTSLHPLGRPSGLAVHPDGNRAAVSATGGIALFSLDGSTLLSNTIPRAPFTVAVSTSGDAELVAQSGFVAQAELWERDSGAEFKLVDLPAALAQRTVAPVTLPDGRPVLTSWDGNEFPNTRMYDAETLTELGRIDAIALGEGFSPDGRLYGTVKNDSAQQYCTRRVGVWETSTWQLEAVLEELPARSESCVSIASVTFSSDGSRMMATTDEGVHGLWSTETWEQLEMPLELGSVVNASFGPNGRLLATVDLDGVITMRDADTFESGQVLVGANPPGDLAGSSVTWSSDGSVLLSQFDSQPRLWDTDTGRQLGDPFPNDPGALYKTTGSTALATVVGDRVHVWNTDIETWPEIACRAAGRNMTQAEWEQFGPLGEPYRATCPQYPAGV